MSQTTIEIMDSAEAASVLRCSPRTVQRMAKSGVLPHVKKGAGPNGSYLFDGQTIREIAAKNESPAPD